MKKWCIFLMGIVIWTSCEKKDQFIPRSFNDVELETIFLDSLLSIRAIDILNDGSLAFAANRGVFGLYDPNSNRWQTSTQMHDTMQVDFRAIAHTATDFFMLSIDNPALLYKTGDNGTMELVYHEEAEGVFYDALLFWNDDEGIAVGDSMNGCLSIIVTRDGGSTWKKLACSTLPKAEAGEGAFAASNTSIEIMGNTTWIATTAGNIYRSEDKGLHWEVIKTPMAHVLATEGIYSIDFYDALHGFAIGGDYTKPNGNHANKMRTKDGGQTWQLVAINKDPGYRSCVQYIPNSNAQELVAIGFNGLDFSNDAGESWKHISDEPFYTIRFINDSVAYAAGSKRISKLSFRERRQ